MIGFEALLHPRPKSKLSTSKAFKHSFINMPNLTPETWLEQATLVREIQHLRTAARILAIGRPERARASEAALDLAKAREAQLLPETQLMLLKWSEQVTTLQAPSISDHGDRLLWMLEKFKHDGFN